jgi:hypothetical protein
MEAILDLLQAFSLNFLEVMIAGFFIFCIGFWLGNKKAKRLTEEIYGLQRDVLDLNAEILYGKDDAHISETPVIGIKHDPLKGAKLAK